jgi:2-octaprenyl-6-methoxyphenol hydroxylase
MEVLLAACRHQPGLELLLGQAASASEAHQRQLTVIAEGGRSPSRDQLGIPFWGWRYQQACLTAQVQLKGNSDHTAWELFRPEGPLAVLPLGKGLAQVVWSAPQERCNQRAALPEAAFLEALTAVLPSGIEALGLRDQPASFPLEWRLAPRLGQGQQLLCGESGHRCHPVGGQGLNLCWRDVAVLAQEATAVSKGRQSVRQLVRRYGRRRWLDLLATLVATDLLVRLFSNRQPVLLALRSLVLGMLGRSGPLRQGVLQLATYGLGPRSLDKNGVNPE